MMATAETDLRIRLVERLYAIRITALLACIPSRDVRPIAIDFNEFIRIIHDQHYTVPSGNHDA
jgi:hypothetical protein